MQIRVEGAAWIEEDMGANRIGGISSVHGFVNETVGSRLVFTLGEV